jgi:glycerol 3-phosphatase-2
LPTGKDAGVTDPAPSSNTTAVLTACAVPARAFDVALLDLDGVIYVGDEAVPEAADALARAAEAGMRLEFVTNNALRTPDEVAAKLVGVGVPARGEQVVTSAQAAARLLTQRLPPGSSVLVAGGRGLHVAVTEAGFVVVSSADDRPAAVVLGYDPTLDYRRLAEAALAVHRGALFVAANRDATVPTPRGPMPGMGSLTALVVTATGQEPLVAGKPERALHAESVQRSGARNPIIVGDRLDTDMEGARRADTPGLLVFTGVTDVAALIHAAPERRPTMIARDLRGLLHEHPAAVAGRCGDARARYDARERRVIVTAAAPADRQDDLDPLRAAATAAWDALDAGFHVDGVDGLPT